MSQTREHYVMGYAAQSGKCEMVYSVQIEVVRWRHEVEAGEPYRMIYVDSSNDNVKRGI